MHVIREDGSLDPTLDPGLSIDQVVALYKAMLRTRIVDDRLEKLQRQGRIAFHVGSLGEEAAIIGSHAITHPPSILSISFDGLYSSRQKFEDLSILFDVLAAPLQSILVPQSYKIKSSSYEMNLSDFFTSLC